MKEALVIIGALAVLAYLLAQSLFVALQPLFVVLSSHLH